MIGIDPQDQEVGAVDLYVGESPRHRIVVADYYAGAPARDAPRHASRVHSDGKSTRFPAR
jgi:hypothetical protein